MGLGINIKGNIRSSITLSSIRECISANCNGLFRDFLSFDEKEGRLDVILHPCEEPVFFERNDDVLTCSAKTNSVGPGYHAWLVELIENIGEDLQIRWYWELEEDETYYRDEAGYYTNRDYRQLQVEMLRWLKALCRTTLDKDKEDRLTMISFPAGSPRMCMDYFAVSPMGFWDQTWFERVASGEPEELDWAGEQFFIWWKKEAGKEFFRNTGVALLNVDCPWHSPGDEKETKALMLIDQCFSKANEMDETISLPFQDWQYVKDLLADEDPIIPPTEFGYRKNLMTFDLADDWMIDVPGHFYQDVDESTLIFYDHTWTVRSVAYSIKKTTTDREYAETFFDDNDNLVSATEIIHSTTDLVGKAIIFYTAEEQGSGYWILQGVRVQNDRFLLSTICYPNEDYRDQAVEFWNSVQR